MVQKHKSIYTGNLDTANKIILLNEKMKVKSDILRWRGKEE
jgi:hypothetical protein